MSIDVRNVTVTTSTVDADTGEVVTRRARDPFNPAAGYDELARVPAPLADPIEARLAALEAKAAEADSLKAVLVDKGVIAEADVVAIGGTNGGAGGAVAGAAGGVGTLAHGLCASGAGGGGTTSADFAGGAGPTTPSANYYPATMAGGAAGSNPGRDGALWLPHPGVGIYSQGGTGGGSSNTGAGGAGGNAAQGGSGGGGGGAGTTGGAGGRGGAGYIVIVAL